MVHAAMTANGSSVRFLGRERHPPQLLQPQVPRLPRCHRLARLLMTFGVKPGDRICYLCGNTLELLEAYYGVVLAGAILTRCWWLQAAMPK